MNQTFKQDFVYCKAAALLQPSVQLTWPVHVSFFFSTLGLKQAIQSLSFKILNPYLGQFFV